MHGFENPQALVEIDWAVGLEVAGNCGGLLLVAVEFVVVMGAVISISKATRVDGSQVFLAC